MESRRLSNLELNEGFLTKWSNLYPAANLWFQQFCLFVVVVFSKQHINELIVFDRHAGFSEQCLILITQAWLDLSRNILKTNYYYCSCCIILSPHSSILKLFSSSPSFPTDPFSSGQTSQPASRLSLLMRFPLLHFIFPLFWSFPTCPSSSSCDHHLHPTFPFFCQSCLGSCAAEAASAFIAAAAAISTPLQPPSKTLFIAEAVEWPGAGWTDLGVSGTAGGTLLPPLPCVCHCCKGCVWIKWAR